MSTFCRFLLVLVLVFVPASTAFATITLDPPGPNNRVQGNQVPEGRYVGTVDRDGGSPDNEDGWSMRLSAPATDENGDVIDEDGDGMPDFPAGSILYFEPTDLGGSGNDRREIKEALDQAVNQGDDNNSVTISNGKVTRASTRAGGGRGDG